MRTFRTSCGGLTEEGVQQYRREAGKCSYIKEWKEQAMGSRDKRGREKKKPKKTESKPVSRPARPMVEYKPVAPPPPVPPSENKT
jgi:hypothetical protein